MNRLIATINRLVCNSARSLFTVVLLIAALPASYANDNAISSDLQLLARDAITINSVNLTAKQFFKSYTSNHADERRSAELYLLGVMDATEGKSWCDYRTFKPDTLRGRIFEGFKKLDGRRLNERASKVIEDILNQLNQYHPCGRKK